MTSDPGFKIGEIVTELGGRVLHGDPEQTFSDFCIDSRFVGNQTVFVPLMGQNRDGHQFVIDSLGKGAVATLVRSGHHQVHEILNWLNERENRKGYHDLADVCVIEVRHTLVALQKLAGWFRRQHAAKVIGVTGSVGKTGTKEMLIQLLCNKYESVGTEKNFNNEIGVPLALSKIRPHTEMAVIEMAMRARGEISLLSRIAQPDLALITNTAGSHVGRLGSFDEVFRAKCEIADGMSDDSVVVLNRRDTNVLRSMEELTQRRGGPRSLRFRYFDPSASYANTALPPFVSPGDPPDIDKLPAADVWIEDVRPQGLDGTLMTLCSADERVEAELPIMGRGAVENLAAAASVVRELGMSLQEVADAAPSLLPAPQRLNLFQLAKDTYLIDDCYNSSPASMVDSLEVLAEIDPSYRKILIMGDMLELGKFETLLHRQAAIAALNLPIDVLFAVGPRMNAVNEVLGREDIELFYIEGHSELRERSFGQSDSKYGGRSSFGNQPRDKRDQKQTVILDDRAAAKLSALLINQLQQYQVPTVIMVKGSRALHLERVVNELLAEADHS